MLDSYSYQLMHCIHLCNYTVFTEREINAFQKLWFVEVAPAKNSQYVSQCVVTRSCQNSSDTEHSWSRIALGSKVGNTAAVASAAWQENLFLYCTPVRNLPISLDTEC